ncbi:MAG: class I SAM-dependent methyltransferase [Pseudomonadota bacterium]|nr:class I SAM-dependent methyltransferase [Pseudomonadota bacterium]
MSEFSSSWLDIREGADARARNVDLVTALSTYVDELEEIHLMDLGAGTGGLFRYLAPRLGRHQTWQLVDCSSSLLEQVENRLTRWAGQHELIVRSKVGMWYASNSVREYCVDTEIWDLVSGFADFPTDPSADVITASAFIDLVSLSWIEQLVAFCRKAQTSFYGCLTYNGIIEWSPGHSCDRAFLQLLNNDQRRDKGMGPALGPEAFQVINNSFRSSGFVVKTGSSPWILDSNDCQLQKALLLQWVRLLGQKSGWPVWKINEWNEFRLAAIVEGKSQLKVGHQDIWVVPADRV